MSSPSPRHAIEIAELTRSFGSGQQRKVAVDRLSLQIAPGEMFGLLGPNGAGKTSTVKMLMTVLLPTSGHARIMGDDVVARAQQVRRRTGVILGGDAGLYARLSAKDNLHLFADFYGIPYRRQKRRIPELLDMVGLLGNERKRVESFSRGMKQRLHIARGLLHDPDVVILDEPSNGIDPVGARELRELVRSQVREGRTVLMTTHYMFEADELCDRVAVMRNGRKIAEGTPESLKKQTDGQVVISLGITGATDAHLSRLRSLPGIQSVNMSQHDGSQSLDLYCDQGTDPTAAVLRELRELPVLRVTRREPTLEDAYVSLVAGGAD
ncbi:ABC transporter ATP-binding protein [Streptomyces chromofuscus]|uniref:ABC transporter ATP-binding protein n=1 Tax=Streptomyces chromofuscus TaxID=42881 RepID=UPI0016764E76|nr:ABC transporter ATP-binding protein [Streptomyces chromofuscus]GGT43322.1 daunorubicin resistance protein DrrA family ABC transporter ATP-binding protein [Streptomyces chromofuscus]